MTDEKAPRPYTWYDIPAGARAVECSGGSCGAMIYKIDSPKTPGAKIPISVEPAGAFHPTATEKGRGINHFQDCPDAADFSRPRRR